MTGLVRGGAAASVPGGMSADVSIIGAKGFIGSHLQRHFEGLGASVRTYGRNDEARLLADEHSTVFYCAGFTGDFAQNPAATVEAHAGLIGRFIAQGRFLRLVYCSSTRLYDSSGVALADERTALALSPELPRHLYDLSKALGENLCLIDPQKRCVVARLSSVFDGDSEDAPGFLSELLKSAKQGQPFSLVSAPGAMRDYIAIKDTVAALSTLAEHGEAGIYNVASGFATRNSEISQILAEARIKLSFEKSEPGPPLPGIDIRKLVALGVTPQNPLDVIRKLFHV